MPNITYSNENNIDLFAIVTIIKSNNETINLTSTDEIFCYNSIEYIPGIDFSEFSNVALNSLDNGHITLNVINGCNIPSLSDLFNASIQIGFGSKNNLTNIYSFFIGIIIATTYTSINTKIEIAPISYSLKRGIGEFYSNLCRAEFGDSRCKINKQNFSFTGSITYSNERLLRGTHQKQQSGYFVNGTIDFINGQSFRILDDSNDKILIATIPEYQININDQYIITAGCDKTTTSCKKFCNIINFRGEPFINS